MSLDRQAAKAAGYTDAEIDAYEAEQKQKGAPAQEVAGTEPPPPPPPSATQNQTNDVNYGELAATMGMAAAPYVLPTAGAAVAGGAGYGLYKFGKGVLETGRDISQAMKSQSAVAEKNVELQRERMGERVARNAPRPGPTQILGPSGQPLPASAPAPQPVSGPVAPNPAASQPSIAERVRQIAMQRITPVAQAVAPIARAATGVGAALMPGNMGQNYAAQFPQSGPMRGMEINPNTGRPWTPAELQQYNAQFQ